MNRSTYLADPYVRSFIEWATHFVTGEWGLVHSWESGKSEHFCCETLFDAYSDYNWKDRNFENTAILLAGFRLKLRKATTLDSPTYEDKIMFLKVAKDVMQWGGINNNQSLCDLGENSLEQLKSNAKLLRPDTADTDKLSGFKYMNAGYSKIYSLIVDDLPIYDSRVACTLASLILLFCNEKSLSVVPPNLYLGVPQGKGEKVNRFPSLGHLTLRKIQGAQYTLHAKSNVMAAWILGELAQKGKFAALPRERRVDALQSALFMIGYEPLKPGAIRKPHPES